MREVKQRFGIGVRRLYKIWRDEPVFVLLQHTEYARTASEEASMDDNVAPDARVASAGDEEENEPQTFRARIEKAVESVEWMLKNRSNSFVPLNKMAFMPIYGKTRKNPLLKN